MLKAVCSTSRAERHEFADSVQLTFPIAFELADGPGYRQDRNPAPSSLDRDKPPAVISDATQEMMAWSPWTVSPAPRLSSGQAYQPPADDQWQVRVEMTLDDAEALVEGLRSLIAVAKENAVAQQETISAALGFAGMKIGADFKAAPPRFSSAQLEALSRKPVKRHLEPERNGRLVHQLFASARVEKRFPS